MSDTGAGVQSVVVSGQQAGDGAATLSGGTWTTGELTLAQGPNSLVATATDKVGNTRTAVLAVNVNVALPTVTILSPPNNTITALDTLTVRYKVDNGPEQAQRFDLVEGTRTLEVVSPPNEAGQVGKASVVVIRDATPPNAPTLATADNLTNLDPEWTWTSNGDNTGGSGTKAPPAYQYSLNGGAWVNLATAKHVIANAADGAYRLTVREQDKAGNWSAASNEVPITVDKTAPVVTITSPADGFLTNQASVVINWTTQDGSAAPVAGTRTENLLQDDGVANIVTVNSAPDAAGNVGTRQISVYRRSNVIFVRGANTGTANGQTWATGYTTLQAALAAATSGKQIWVAAGTYASAATATGFVMKTGVSIYGGFNAAGNQRNLADRVFNSATLTVLRNTSGDVITMNGTSASPVQNLSVDGFEVRYEKMSGFRLNWATNVTIENCHVTHVLDQGLSLTGDSSSITVRNTRFTGHGFTIGPVSLQGEEAIFDGVEFSGNDFPTEYTHMLNLYFTRATVTNSRFLDVRDHAANRHIRFEGSFLTVQNCDFNAPDQARAISSTNGVTVSGNTYRVR